jgi:hypothetical protein
MPIIVRRFAVRAPSGLVHGEAGRQDLGFDIQAACGVRRQRAACGVSVQVVALAPVRWRTGW